MYNLKTDTGTRNSPEKPYVVSQYQSNASRRVIQAVGAVILCGTLSACSLTSTLGTASTDKQLVTNSITKPVEQNGVASTDAELIKTVVADASSNQSSDILAWQNPDTGNKGTITAIDKFVGSHGQKCKKFQTTVDTFMGISLYNGETCELKKGFWVLSWFIRHDS